MNSRRPGNEEFITLQRACNNCQEKSTGVCHCTRYSTSGQGFSVFVWMTKKDAPLPLPPPKKKTKEYVCTNYTIKYSSAFLCKWKVCHFSQLKREGEIARRELGSINACIIPSQVRSFPWLFGWWKKPTALPKKKKKQKYICTLKYRSFLFLESEVCQNQFTQHKEIVNRRDLVSVIAYISTLGLEFPMFVCVIQKKKKLRQKEYTYQKNNFMPFPVLHSSLKLVQKWQRYCLEKIAVFCHCFI